MSSESSICRIDWRPSRLLCACLSCLGILGAVSVWLSAMPMVAKLPLACAALAHGGWLARREFTRLPFSLEWPCSGDGIVLSRPDRAQALAEVCLSVRGPLASLRARDPEGRVFRAFWSPDTLSPSDRRLLRMASGDSHVDSGPALATMQG